MRSIKLFVFVFLGIFLISSVSAWTVTANNFETDILVTRDQINDMSWSSEGLSDWFELPKDGRLLFHTVVEDAWVVHNRSGAYKTILNLDKDFWGENSAWRNTVARSTGFRQITMFGSNQVVTYTDDELYLYDENGNKLTNVPNSDNQKLPITCDPDCNDIQGYDLNFSYPIKAGDRIRISTMSNSDPNSRVILNYIYKSSNSGDNQPVSGTGSGTTSQTIQISLTPSYEGKILSPPTLSIDDSKFRISDSSFVNNDDGSQTITVTVEEIIIPPMCGNNVIESGEFCDGTSLNSQTCKTQGFTGGSLTCSSSCTFDTSGCFRINNLYWTDGQNTKISSIDQGRQVKAFTLWNSGTLEGKNIEYTILKKESLWGIDWLKKDIVVDSGSTNSVFLDWQAGKKSDETFDIGEFYFKIKVDGQELNSQSFPNGTLKVEASLIPPQCGDGIINQDWETCDGGSNCISPGQENQCTCVDGYIPDEDTNGCTPINEEEIPEVCSDIETQSLCDATDLVNDTIGNLYGTCTYDTIGKCAWNTDDEICEVQTEKTYFDENDNEIDEEEKETICEPLPTQPTYPKICNYNDQLTGSCETDIELTVSYTLTSTSDTTCEQIPDKKISCARVTKLPVFNAWNLIISILGITLIYLISRRK